MSEIKEFSCVGFGEVIDERRFINYFYIVLQDEKYEYQIRFDMEVFKCYSQMIKFPIPIKLDLQNYEILKQTNIHDANEQDLRNIMKAKELELKAANAFRQPERCEKKKNKICTLPFLALRNILKTQNKTACIVQRKK